jgi:assimilatory nitrate reductase catalytic subunit
MIPGELMLDVNSQDAGSLGIRDGMSVRVISARAELTATARITDCVSKGDVFLPMHDSRVNQLTHASYDPLSRQPSYKYCAVRVELA